MSWIYLFIAGIFEILWAVSLRYCDGQKNIIALILVITFNILNFVFLELASKGIPMSIAYTVLTSIGIAGIFMFDIFLFKHSISLKSIMHLFLIFIGIVGLIFKK